MSLYTNEILSGVLVAALGAGVIGFAFNQADIAAASGYELTAEFSAVDGLGLGSEVRLFGIAVGSVSGMELGEDLRRARVRMRVAPEVKLTTDTAVKILSHSLLGGKYLEFEPGGDEEYLEPGDEIIYTQDSILIIDLLQKMIIDSEAKRKAKREAAKNS